MENRNLRPDAPLPRWLRRSGPLPQPIITPVIIDINEDIESENSSNRITEIEELQDPVLASTRQGTGNVLIQHAQDLSSGLENQFPDMPNNARQWIEGSIQMAQGGLTQTQFIDLQRSAQVSFASLLAFLRSKNQGLDSLPTEILLMIIQSLIRVSKIQPEDLQNLSLTNRRMQEVLRDNRHIIWRAFLEVHFPDYKVVVIHPNESQADGTTRLKKVFYHLKALEAFWIDVSKNDRTSRLVNSLKYEVFMILRDKPDIFMHDIVWAAKHWAANGENTVYWRYEIDVMIEGRYRKHLAEWLGDLVNVRDIPIDEIFRKMRLSKYVKLLNRMTEPRRDDTIRSLMSSLQSSWRDWNDMHRIVSDLCTNAERSQLNYDFVLDVLKQIPFPFLPDGTVDVMSLTERSRDVRTWIEQLGTFPLIALPLGICRWKMTAIAERIAEML